jgi:Na+/proline symporter
MNGTLPTLAFVFLVLAYSLWQGFRLRKVYPGLEGFFVMNKQLHAKELGTSFAASNISVATVVLSLGVVGYTYGFLAGVWVTLCWIFGTLLFSFLIAKPRMQSYLKIGHTLHEFIGEYYDVPGRRPYVRLTAAFLTVLVYWGALGIEFFAAVILFTKLAASPSPILIALITAIVIIVYTIHGGYSAATVADYGRLILVFVGFVVLGGLALGKQMTAIPGSLFRISGSLSRFDLAWAIAVFISLVPFHLSAMDMWQRGVAAGGNVSAIRRGLIKSLPICILWLIPAYVGSLVHTLGATPSSVNPSSANVNYVVLNIFDYVAPLVRPWLWEWVLQPIVYGSLVATLASTGDSLLISMIFTFMYDIYGSFRKINFATMSKDQERTFLSRGKYWAGALGLSSVFIVFVGLSAASLYDLIISSFSIQIILFWPVIFALWFPNKDFTRTRFLAFSGLVGGLIVAILMIGMYLTGKAPILILNLSPIAAFVVTLIPYLFALYLAPKKQEA